MLDLNNIYKDAEQKMQKNIENLTKELAKIRTDRAHPNLLESIQVEYYYLIIRLLVLTKKQPPKLKFKN